MRRWLWWFLILFTGSSWEFWYRDRSDRVACRAAQTSQFTRSIAFLAKMASFHLHCSYSYTLQVLIMHAVTVSPTVVSFSTCDINRPPIIEIHTHTQPQTYYYKYMPVPLRQYTLIRSCFSSYLEFRKCKFYCFLSLSLSLTLSRKCHYKQMLF